MRCRLLKTWALAPCCSRRPLGVRRIRMGRELSWRSRLGTCRALLLAGPPFCARSMLVSSDDGAVDEVDVPVEAAFLIRLALKFVQDSPPEPGLLPPVEATRNRLPLSVTLRELAPRCSSTKEPENPVDDAPVTLGGSANSPPFRRKQGGRASATADLSGLLDASLLQHWRRFIDLQTHPSPPTHGLRKSPATL